ncbi:MAG TPA: VPLPA-CTERM sorting domain-containing protein [Gammaproteobacteria bacterium]
MKYQQRKLIVALSLCAAVVPSLASAVAISGQGTWESTLQGRDLDGNLATAEAYYDNALNITWLADANYAHTSGYSAQGWMSWNTATAWATALEINGIAGWRLPTTVDVNNDGADYSDLYQGMDTGFNITTHSEMSHMFYETLGNTAWYDTTGAATGCTAPDYCLSNTGPFSNLLAENYWSSTVIVTYYSVWGFTFGTGGQGDLTMFSDNYAWAVHDGDIGLAIPSVPVPAAVWLFGSGLLGFVSVAKRNEVA